MHWGPNAVRKNFKVKVAVGCFWLLGAEVALCRERNQGALEAAVVVMLRNNVQSRARGKIPVDRRAVVVGLLVTNLVVEMLQAGWHRCATGKPLMIPAQDRCSRLDDGRSRPVIACGRLTSKEMIRGPLHARWALGIREGQRAMGYIAERMAVDVDVDWAVDWTELLPTQAAQGTPGFWLFNALPSHYAKGRSPWRL